MSRKQARSLSTDPSSTGHPARPPWKQRWVLVVSGIAVIGGCVLFKVMAGNPAAEAQLFGKRKAEQEAPPQPRQHAESSPRQTSPRAERPKHDVMAVVNGQDIRRDALAAACVDRYGEEVLEGLINKRLIQHHCRNRGLNVTAEDIDAEIDRMAKRFKIGREQWLDMLERERGINEQQYKLDILWPTLALRKLAADRLTVDDTEIQKAYESRYGEAVKARLIVVESREKAEQLHRQLSQQPGEFPRLAMQHSQDINSASIGGLIQPIRHHVGDPNIEQAVFQLEPNEISPIIPVANQFAILKCEERLPERDVPLEEVRNDLVERINENKLRDVAGNLFKKLQDSATIQNVWNDPQLRQQMPGVVATINGEPIPYRDLAEECLLRHGEEVLDVEISHLLLQQALAQADLTVTQQDLDREIAHAAKLAGVVTSQGEPDFEKWFAMATEEQQVTKELYLRDSVWPSAALKKLTNDSVDVDQADLQKSFEANFGPRVRCRAIVLGEMRRAQEVWAKARQNPSLEYFGDLAAEYSIEPQTKALRGEVPPVRRFSGQPQLEKVAFELDEGELSGIIQMDDKFVVLKCEGRTEPVEVELEDVQDSLRQDILEKKLRMAMSNMFARIRTEARIDNYLAGTSQAPERVKPESQPQSPRRDAAVRPAGAVRR